MDHSTEVIQQIGGQLAGLVGAPVSGTSDDDLCAFAVALEGAGRFLDALRTTVAAEIDKRSASKIDGLSDRYGFSKGAQLLEFLTRVSPAEAARRVRVGRATAATTTLVGDELPPQHPQVAAALRSGEIGIDSAAVIIRCLDQASPQAKSEEIAVAETELVTAATHDSADLIGVQARAWREALNPDGAEPRDERIHRMRSFRIGRELENGLTPFSGVAEPYFAALLRTAINNANKPGVSPRFLSEADQQTGLSIVEGDGAADDDDCRGVGEIVSVADPRTREQRNYDVLQGVVTAGLRSTGTKTGEMRDLAQVTATVTMHDLVSGDGAAWIDDVAEPISAAAVAELVCSTGLAKVIIGPNGEPLYLGKHKRYFTAAQMRALGVRDGGCVWPGCGAPASWADGHHVKPWAAGGATDIDNGVLLCPYHHHKLHRSGFRISMIDARPHMLLTPAMDPAQKWRPIGKSRIEAVQVRRKKAG
jgi:hypothetical protein